MKRFPTYRLTLCEAGAGSIGLILVVLLLCVSAAAQTAEISAIRGTLVVAVPLKDGPVVCADKRLYNDQTGGFTDDFVKIKRVGNTALFVATNTVGFLDRTTGKIEFDVFKITERYTAERPFVPAQPYWDGLKDELRKQLLEYLKKRPYKDWPETDRANNRLLFNLVFYATVKGRARSYSVRAFYEKAPIPVVQIPAVVSEEVRSPKLSGKGRDVMAVLARQPKLGSDPSILQFDTARFDIDSVTTADAVRFAAKLFAVTNRSVPQARVSAVYDCAVLSYQNGFQWIDASGRPITSK